MSEAEQHDRRLLDLDRATCGECGDNFRINPDNDLCHWCDNALAKPAPTIFQRLIAPIRKALSQ